MTLKHSSLSMAAAILGLFATSCVNDYTINDTDINTAVKMDVSEVSACDATLTLTPTQEVSSYIFAGPVEDGTFDHVGSDAIAGLEWIKANGKSYPSPFSETFGNLDPATSYLVGYVAVNEKGVIVSAPSFGTFKTGTTGLTVKADCTGEKAPFIYTYSIVPNSSTASFRYIATSDPATVKYDETSLYELLAQGGDGVLTSQAAVDVTEEHAKKQDFLVAALPYDKLGRPGKVVTANVYTSTVVGVMCGGQLQVLGQADPDVAVYEGEVNLPAKASFTISCNGEEYGYVSYSGNGGVGRLDTQSNTAAPVSVFKYSTYVKYLYKSVGQMTLEGNPFWTNMNGDARVKVRADFSNEDGIPRYRLDIVETDSKVVFRENFDFLVAGGYYWAADKAGAAGPGYPDNDPSVIEGTEACVPGKAAYTDGGTLMLKSSGGDDVEGVIPGASYLKNRDLEGWEYFRCYEQALAVRIGKSDKTYIETRLTTPALKALASPSTVVVEVVLSRLGAGTDPVAISTTGGGRLVSATYFTHVSPSEVDGTAKINSANEFLADAEVCPQVANADLNKPISTIRIVVEEATSDTKISVYPYKGNAGIANSRCFCHGITVTGK
ncbi:MAG: hypothetical protein ACI3ZC_04630 [Candidatus Cryptobacteroides sp.]